MSTDSLTTTPPFQQVESMCKVITFPIKLICLMGLCIKCHMPLAQLKKARLRDLLLWIHCSGRDIKWLLRLGHWKNRFSLSWIIHFGGGQQTRRGNWVVLWRGTPGEWLYFPPSTRINLSTHVNELPWRILQPRSRITAPANKLTTTQWRAARQNHQLSCYLILSPEKL